MRTLILALASLVLTGCFEADEAAPEDGDPAGESTTESWDDEDDERRGDEDCEQIAEDAYVECIDAGGSEEDCGLRAEAAYADCLEA